MHYYISKLYELKNYRGLSGYTNIDFLHLSNVCFNVESENKIDFFFGGKWMDKKLFDL